MFLIFLLILSISIYAAVKIHTNADTHYSQNYYSNKDNEDAWALFKNIDERNEPPHLFKCKKCNQYLSYNTLKYNNNEAYCKYCSVKIDKILAKQFKEEKEKEIFFKKLI